MELHLPLALQVALYAASITIVVLVLVLVPVLLQFRKQVACLVGAVEELEAELKPLAREARVVTVRLADLSERAQAQWSEVEGMIDTVRSWSDRADHLVGAIGTAVELRILAATRGVGALRTGLGTFLHVLLNRDPQINNGKRGNHERSSPG